MSEASHMLKMRQPALSRAEFTHDYKCEALLVTDDSGSCSGIVGSFKRVVRSVAYLQYGVCPSVLSVGMFSLVRCGMGESE
jgi:hypothetical protein